MPRLYDRTKNNGLFLGNCVFSKSAILKTMFQQAAPVFKINDRSRTNVNPIKRTIVFGYLYERGNNKEENANIGERKKNNFMEL